VIALAPGTKVYLACRQVSMQKGFDGLTALASQVCGADPYSGHLFLFRGKRGDYFKGLEKCRFVWPPLVDGGIVLSPAQLALLIEDIDWRRTVAPDPVTAPTLV
jgi:transposase